MTQTTVPAKLGNARLICFTEPFSRYRFDANAVSGRTDTPELMAAFDDVAALARGYRESAADDLALAEADMEVGYESLPD